MNALIFDTETTGLPDYKLPIDHPSQPYIVQLAAILSDDDGEVKGSMNVIIKPSGWTIPSEASNVHGISTGDALEYGVPIELALHMFMELYKKADYLVAHNIDFDLRMLRRYAKNKDTDIFTDGMTVNYDTMKAMTNVCKLDLTERQKAAQVRNKDGGWAPAGGWPKYKSPTLSESYWHFFTEAIEGAHDAMVDVEACKDIFYELMSELKEVS